jgi:pyruvate/2-oxoglutarate/acetoin dehydrogenase E1 component/TPP-dependent pyruvate/acetoin dehydrogenase alpha subunit
MKATTNNNNNELSFDEFKKAILDDYTLAINSREASLLGRREVLTGKAKFGIFGDGKELPNLAMAKVFRKGDFRSGYYRDQTFMMAIGEYSPQQMFSALYAHADLEADPGSGGRQMSGHYSTRSINDDGTWMNLTEKYNSSADISPTAGQMPRLLGLAQASKVYKDVEELKDWTNFSKNGNEVAFGTIGNASTSEGLFWETLNAAGVMQVPMIMSVWDDEYGISVHAKDHTVKESISEALKGFQRDENKNGFEIFVVKGWDYPALIDTYTKAEKIAREEHVPVLVHVIELTQPQGHSTSGSHERYKSTERLQWEKEFDGIVKMREWMLEKGIAYEEELLEIEKGAKKAIREAKGIAWKKYITPIKEVQKEVFNMLKELASKSKRGEKIAEYNAMLAALKEPGYKESIQAARVALRYCAKEDFEIKNKIQAWIKDFNLQRQSDYSSHVWSETENAAFKIKAVSPTYDENSKEVDARIVLRDNFDKIFETRPEVLTFGEDTGKIGDVNQGLEGLQEKHGAIRIADTGIREATIIGQGIGLAMRGLRPIAEIQYLDYLMYGLQTISDDLASLHYRTVGGQRAPMIIRTRGHRLEGVWHAGSPLGKLINAMRGINVLVPRNMTKAAGFYNTLLQSDEPGLVIEPLNGYRKKEKMPNNLGEFRTPIGEVEVTKEGKHITLVTYGSTFHIVADAANQLEEVGIYAEVIDIQSILPFDLNHDIAKSISKTSRLLVIDEDLPHGASAYILQRIVEEQNAYKYLDSAPRTLTAKEHRPAYASDGDYFSKPSAEDVFDTVYEIMHEFNPKKYPEIYNYKYSDLLVGYK